MRIVRIGVVLALLCISFDAIAQEQKLAVTGKLIRAMAMGGEGAALFSIDNY